MLSVQYRPHGYLGGAILSMYTGGINLGCIVVRVDACRRGIFNCEILYCYSGPGLLVTCV